MSDPTAQDDLGFHALWPFLSIAFGLAWGLFALFALFPGPIERLFGPLSGSHPLFILAVYAPAIAAFVLVLARGGPRALGRFLSRLLLWRVPALWWIVLLLAIPAVYLAGALVKGTPDLLPPARGLLAAAAFMMVLGPVEEFGWRGVALPLLQRRMAPLWAGIVLGLVWGAWHLPAFLLSGTVQSGWSFTPFLVGSVAVSVIVTGLFNASRGSLLLAALFHFQLNNPAWPDAQPHDTVFFVLLAALLVWLRRDEMLSRGGAVTRAIPRPTGAA